MVDNDRVIDMVNVGKVLQGPWVQSPGVPTRKTQEDPVMARARIQRRWLFQGAGDQGLDIVLREPSQDDYIGDLLPPPAIRALSDRHDSPVRWYPQDGDRVIVLMTSGAVILVAQSSGQFVTGRRPEAEGEPPTPNVLPLRRV